MYRGKENETQRGIGEDGYKSEKKVSTMLWVEHRTFCSVGRRSTIEPHGRSYIRSATGRVIKVGPVSVFLVSSERALADDERALWWARLRDAYRVASWE